MNGNNNVNLEQGNFLFFYFKHYFFFNLHLALYVSKLVEEATSDRNPEVPRRPCAFAQRTHS